MPRCKPPKYCSQQVARRLMACAACAAVLFNIPYCFMFTYNSNGDLVTSWFFHTEYVIVIKFLAPRALHRLPLSRNSNLRQFPSRFARQNEYFHSNTFRANFNFSWKSGEIATKYISLQVVRSAELVPIRNIRSGTGRLSVHCKRHHDPLRDKVP